MDTCGHQQDTPTVIFCWCTQVHMSCRVKPGKGSDLNIVAAVGTEASRRMEVS